MGIKCRRQNTRWLHDAERGVPRHHDRNRGLERRVTVSLKVQLLRQFL